MDIKVIVALIGVSGVLVSALVQYYLGSQSENRKKIIEIRAQAYLDFLNAVSEIAGSAKHAEDRSLDQLQKVIKAKTRTVLVGSKEVVTAINHFWSEHGALDTPGAYTAYTLIVSAMRKDLSEKESLPASLLSGALFGKKNA